jgi:hypothetical protein
MASMTPAQDPAAALAIDEPLAATLDRWRNESAALDRAGVYDWLTARIAADRVLEIGCGFGLSTAALTRGGKQVFALDNRLDCLEATQALVPGVTLGMADVTHYDNRLIADLEAFEPRAVVCWLAGAPAEALPRDVPSAYAVMQHRLQLQHAVVRLASRLDTVQTVHLADRTAFPWKMTAVGRKTMSGMIVAAVIADAPFELNEVDVQFRKIDGIDLAGKQGTALAGVVPVVGEATLKRRHNVT